MTDRSSSIIKNLIFSLRLLSSTDCSVVLIKGDSSITFQSYDNDKQREFLAQRITLIEWSSFIKHAGNICKKKIGGISTYYEENVIFFKFLHGSILLVTMLSEGIQAKEVSTQLEKTASELKKFCNEEL
ncbi:MAG: hypothetical protein GY816_03030 [Cytophagales bacterium]|nr:hypothetical protein [Cytophagales bacterium]